MPDVNDFVQALRGGAQSVVGGLNTAGNYLGVPPGDVTNAGGQVVFPTNPVERWLRGSSDAAKQYAASFMGPGLKGTPEQILASAVRDKHSGVIESGRGEEWPQLVNRFFNKRNQIIPKNQQYFEHFDPGYVTNQGRFLSPEEALEIAKAQGQLKPNAPYSQKWGELFGNELK